MDIISKKTNVTTPGDSMIKRKLQYFYRIYEQIDRENTISIYEISQNTGISRNTVSKYLHLMYQNHILQGPYLRVNPAQNYSEYVYLMQFNNPYTAFQSLKGFPHVVYYALLFGKWNTIVITNRFLDLSQLVGVKGIVYQGKRGISLTQKANLLSWVPGVYEAQEYLKNFEGGTPQRKKEVLPVLPWESQEWKLFSTFNHDIRKRKTPVLRKIDVRYEEYISWKETLDRYCTSHTGFYPDGYKSYDHHCFLMSTDYKEQVKEFFSFFPTSSFFMDLGEYLLVIASVKGPDITRWLYCMVHTMEIQGMINRFQHAQFLFHEYVRNNLKKVR
jgi:DNA-binding Lrp family transcriptional regulator